MSDEGKAKLDGRMTPDRVALVREIISDVHDLPVTAVTDIWDDQWAMVKLRDVLRLLEARLDREGGK